MALTAVSLHRYTPPISGEPIEIVRNPNGKLTAQIHALGLLSLPLIETHSQLELLSQAEQIHFFHHTHLIPEKGSDGVINRVRVQVSGKGGGQPKIPFQPGLALGSIVRASEIEKMEQYAEKMAQLDAAKNEIADLKQQLTQLAAEKVEYAAHTEVVTLLTAQETLVNQRISEIATQLTSAATPPSSSSSSGLSSSSAAATPTFPSFHTSARSPIHMGKSTMASQPRGFASMNFQSKYFSIDTLNSLKQSSSGSSSSSSSISTEVNFGGFFVKGGANYARSVSKATAERLTKISTNNNTQGVLVINAFTTSPNVRCFTNITYDKAVLKMIEAAMEGSDTAAKTRLGISDDNRLYILTEAVLGGSFTAIVTFTKKQTSSHESLGSSSLSATSTSFGGHISSPFGSASAQHSSASSSASQNERDSLSSAARLDIQIEFFSQGAVPHFSRQDIETEILKHIDLKPSQFAPADTDEKLAQDALSADRKTQEAAVSKFNMQLQRASVAFANGYRELAASKKTHQVHSMESIYEAFESYAKQMNEDPNSGIPIGFNYDVLTLDTIKEHLKA